MRERFAEWGEIARLHVARMLIDGSLIGPAKNPGTYFYRHQDGIVLAEPPARGGAVTAVITVLEPDTPMFLSEHGHWYSSERATDASLLALRARFARPRAP